METAIDIGSLSEARRPLTKTAAETGEAAYDRAIREFESLESGVSESVVEYFARVHAILMKLTRHQVNDTRPRNQTYSTGQFDFPFPG